MKLLLISNSTMAGEAYLGWCKEYIKSFLKSTTAKKILFIPYAGVSLSSDSLEASYCAYESKVAAVFKTLGYELVSIHHAKNPVEAVEQAEAIAVGGGNTFHLVYELHKNNVMEAIRKKALNGTPYLGWSAGSNVACPGLFTTNDMPIIEPSSFQCLNLIPFQINPHYLDTHPAGHGGETREDRINEYIIVNRNMYVVGLREATALVVENGKMELTGRLPMRIFKYGCTAREVYPGCDLSFLTKSC